MEISLAATDTNWFYSTLAQSTAAIVGLVGAFLIQRLLVTRSEIAQEREQLRQEVLAHWRGRIRAIRKATRRMTRELRPLVEAMESAEEGQEIVFNDAVKLFSPTPADARISAGTRIAASDGTRSELDDAVESLERLRGSLPGSFSDYAKTLRGWSEEPPEPLDDADQDRLEGLDGRAKSGWPLVVVQPLLVHIEHRSLTIQDGKFAGRLAALRDQIGFRPFVVLLGLLVGLMLVGVIGPMLFLDAREGASKGVLLGLFAPLALGLLVYYGYELYRVKQADNLAREHL